MPDITFYSSQNCSFCHAAEQLLQRKGVTQLNKIMVDADPQQRIIMMERTQKRTVPQIFIGNFYVGGYTELAALERAGKLDTLINTGKE